MVDVGNFDHNSFPRLLISRSPCGTRHALAEQIFKVVPGKAWGRRRRGWEGVVGWRRLRHSNVRLCSWLRPSNVRLRLLALHSIALRRPWMHQNRRCSIFRKTLHTPHGFLVCHLSDQSVTLLSKAQLGDRPVSQLGLPIRHVAIGVQHTPCLADPQVTLLSKPLHDGGPKHARYDLD